MFQDIGWKVIMEVVTSWIIDRPFFRKKKKEKEKEKRTDHEPGTTAIDN